MAEAQALMETDHVETSAAEYTHNCSATTHREAVEYVVSVSDLESSTMAAGSNLQQGEVQDLGIDLRSSENSNDSPKVEWQADKKGTGNAMTLSVAGAILRDSGNDKASLAICEEDVEKTGTTVCPVPMNVDEDLQLMHSFSGDRRLFTKTGTGVTESASINPEVQGHVSPVYKFSEKAGYSGVANTSMFPFGTGQSIEHSKTAGGNHSKVAAENVEPCPFNQEELSSSAKSGADQATPGDDVSCIANDRPSQQIELTVISPAAPQCVLQAVCAFSESACSSSFSQLVQPSGTNTETCDNVTSHSSRENTQYTLLATAVSSGCIDSAMTDDPSSHGAATYNSAYKSNDTNTDDSVSRCIGEADTARESHTVAVTTADPGSGASDKSVTCNSGESSQQTQLATTARDLNPVSQSGTASTTAVGGRGAAGEEIITQVSVADIPTVQIKPEPADTGYDHALSSSRQRPQRTPSLLSQMSKTASRQHGTTTSITKRKKRVRITVIRGEWRTAPQANTSKAKTNSSVRQAQAGLGIVIKTEPQSSKSSADSAVPTALYRNAHIKTEPVDDTCSDAQPGTSRMEAAPSTSFEHQPDISSSSSHFSRGIAQGRGHGQGRGRRRGFHSNKVASASGQAEEKPMTEESKIRYCAVQLKQLPPDILNAGMVNLRTYPQVASMLNSRVKGGCRLLPATRLLIKVANPDAFHPVKRRNKLGPRPWQCEICDKTFRTASGRSQHRKIHTGIKEHKCIICGKAFTYKSTLTAHHRTHTDERPFVCKLCGAGFRWAGHLTNHLTTHSKVKPFKCDHCDRSFSQKANLWTHLKRHTGVQPYKCPECNTAFFGKRYLTSHMRRHTGEKPYQCNQCPAAFAHQNTLVAHTRSHNDERPFKCHLCSAAFRQSSHRCTHIRLMHEKPEREGYKPKKQRKPVNMGPKSVAQAKKTAEQASRKAKNETSDTSDEGHLSDLDYDFVEPKTGKKRKKRKKLESTTDSTVCGGLKAVSKKRCKKLKGAEVSLSEAKVSSFSVESEKKTSKTKDKVQKNKKQKTKKGRNASKAVNSSLSDELFETMPKETNKNVKKGKQLKLSKRQRKVPFSDTGKKGPKR